MPRPVVTFLAIVGCVALVALGTAMASGHASRLAEARRLATAERVVAALSDSLVTLRRRVELADSADAVRAARDSAASQRAAESRAARLLARQQGRVRTASLTPILNARRVVREPATTTVAIAEGVVLPVSGRVTSSFARSRRHPVLGVRRPHNGIDLSSPRGAPINAPAAGRVTFAGRKIGGGLVVEISHADGVVTKYAHCSEILVAVGQLVERGTMIATVGSTGLATGPHLHYEVLVNGRQVDPLRHPIVPPASAPVQGQVPAAAAPAPAQGSTQDEAAISSGTREN